MEERESVSGVDFSKVEALQRKRILTFVNHFVAQMTHYLSDFAQTCDHKLLAVSNRIAHLEKSLTLLEEKLDSVPHLSETEPKNLNDAFKST